MNFYTRPSAQTNLCVWRMISGVHVVVLHCYHREQKSCAYIYTNGSVTIRCKKYMFFCDRIKHLVINVIFQCVIGLPFEMFHKWRKVTVMYMSGVIAGWSTL